jgi:hypothetical protein
LVDNPRELEALEAAKKRAKHTPAKKKKADDAKVRRASGQANVAAPVEKAASDETEASGTQTSDSSDEVEKSE